MSSKQAEQPFVDTDVRSGLTDWIGRILKQAAPDSLIAGGGTDDAPSWDPGPRNYEALKHREAVYKAGGPVTSILDARSLMTFGTGIEFDTEQTAVTDDLGRTADEWLTEKMGDWLDLFAIDAGIQSYYAGDAWPEIVETRGGDFSHLNLIDPTTVNPSWDRHGTFTNIEQVIVSNGRPQTHSLDMDDVFHFTHSNATGGPLGESLIDRNMDEIERFASNQVQRANAIRLHGSPHYSISVGSEGQSIPDKLMRRVRNRFRADQIDEETNWVHGGDIEVEELGAPGFEGMGDITETDARMLAWTFDFPLEWTNFGSAGLGDGTPAMSRIVKFERQARAEQRRFMVMLKEVLEEILHRYSPYPRDTTIDVRFGDVVSDQQAVAQWLAQVGWAFHRDEVRELMDHQPWDEDDDREAPPEVAPDAQMGGGEEAGGGMGLFSERDEPGGEAPDPFGNDHEAKEKYANGGRDTGNRSLLHAEADADALTREELVFEDVIDHVLLSDETDRALFAYDPEDVPKAVTERLQTAIATVVSQIDSFSSVNDGERNQLVDTLQDSLETQHGWSINSLRDNLQDMDASLTDAEAELLGRDITQKAVSKAREDYYEEEFDVEEERFYGVNPMNNRTTDACEYLVGETNPNHGGTPVPLDRYRELVVEANQRDPDIEHDPSEYNPHIACRTQYVRAV